MLTRPSFTRRAMLAGSVALATAAAVPAAAQAPSAIGSIRVDVSPLREKDLAAYADRVGVEVARALSQAYAGVSGVRGAPNLVVQIDLVILASLTFGDGASTPPSDAMRGTGTLVDSRGRVISSHPILAAFPADDPAYNYPGNEGRRLAALSGHFASWLRRYTGP